MRQLSGSMKCDADRVALEQWLRSLSAEEIHIGVDAGMEDWAFKAVNGELWFGQLAHRSFRGQYFARSVGVVASCRPERN